MKELFKINQVISKMTNKPKQLDIIRLFSGGNHGITDEQIKEMIKIVNTGANDAKLFLKSKLAVKAKK